MVYDLWDCVATIPPYPHYIGDRGDGHNPDSIFFRCTLRPSPNNVTKGSYNRYWEDIDVDLFFFIRKTLMSTLFFRRRELGIAQGQPCV